MFEQKRDHVEVNLPTIGLDTSISKSPTKKSCRRYWNQLPRCQKNLIILGIAAACLTLLLFLPGEQIVSETTKDQLGHINVAPFKEEHEIPLPQDNSNKDEKVSPPTQFENSFKLINQVEQSFNQIEPQLPANENGDENAILEGQNVNENNNSINSYLNNKPPSQAENEFNKFEANTESVPKVFKGATNDRQRAVVDAFRHSWKGYKEYAWGHDNLKPISMGSHDWFGLGLTIVDALDTMYIMNLEREYEDARSWIDTYLFFDINRDVNLFEVTIRVLGGLLSAYHLSSDKMYLNKATDLGNRLLPCFNSASGIPYSDVNLASLNAHSPKWSPDSSTSEVTTIQLEFRDLSRCTGNPIYEEVIEKVNEKVHALEKTDGLVPIFINANTGMFRNFATISLGARGDSYYEYLLKQWIQTGKKANDFLIADYKTAINGVLMHLTRQTPNVRLTYIGELINGKDFKPKMDHLTCYLPGTLLLGYKAGMPSSHLNLAKELLETCYQTYMKQPTGLAPEITYFNLADDTDTDFYVKSNDAHNLLRPEFIESLYYFYAITGNKTYQDMGWNIFQSFEKYTKVKNGYTSIGNVKNAINTRPRDMMESFWLGETLKYFYLLFSDEHREVDLGKYVFNTEAHLLPVRDN